MFSRGVLGRHEARRRRPRSRTIIRLALISALLAGSATASSAGAGRCEAPSSAAGYFALFRDKNDWTWSGGDQATSVLARNGATYWLMGDTILGTEDPSTGAYARGWRLVANSIIVQRGCSLTRATDTEPAIPAAVNGDRYWAMGGIEHDGELWVTSQRTRRVAGGLGFEPAGVELARFAFRGDRLELRGMIPTPSTGSQSDDVQYSGATVVEGGYAYFYGFRHTPEPLAPHAGYLARVPLVDLARPDRWEYWTGSAWTADRTRAGAIIDGQPTSAAHVRGRWVVLYKELGANGSTVYALTADSPGGPFSRQVLMESPSGTTDGGRNYVTYSPQLHPSLRMASGKMLISISWNGESLFADTGNDADLYKPRFREVTIR